MRHGMKGRKFNRTKSQRSALLKGLACDLFEHEQIKTTLPKAKDLRPYAEKLITAAKSATLHTRRVTLSKLNNNEKITEKLISNLGPRFQERTGGYVRIIKSGFRYGDRAPMAIIELVERQPRAKAVSADATVEAKTE